MSVRSASARATAALPLLPRITLRRAVRSPGDLFPAVPDAGVPVLYGSGGTSVLDDTVYLFACSSVAQLHHPPLVRTPCVRVGPRSADGRQVVVSYSRPLGNFRGEVRLVRITLGR